MEKLTHHALMQICGGNGWRNFDNEIVAEIRAEIKADLAERRQPPAPEPETFLGHFVKLEDREELKQGRFVRKIRRF